MVRRVVWSLRAQEERKQILKFWKQRNKSDAYSRKLSSLFKGAIKLIVEHPHIGRVTDLDNVRVKIVKDYLMIYELAEDAIYILSIWDSRQDPSKLKL